MTLSNYDSTYIQYTYRIYHTNDVYTVYTRGWGCIYGIGTSLLMDELQQGQMSQITDQLCKGPHSFPPQTRTTYKPEEQDNILSSSLPHRQQSTGNKHDNMRDDGNWCPIGKYISRCTLDEWRQQWMDHSDFHWGECNPLSRTPSHIRRQSTIRNALLPLQPYYANRISRIVWGVFISCLGKIDMTINIVVNTFYPEPSSPQGELSTSLSSQQLPELLHKGVPL